MAAAIATPKPSNARPGELLTGGGRAATDGNSQSNGSCTNDRNDCELHGINIDLTPLWLSLFLNRKIDPDGFSTQPVGTGQMSSTYRVSFHEAGKENTPETVVVKFASNDKETFDLGIRFQHYLREAVFYRRFGDLLSAGLNRCFGAVVDKDGYFTMVLEDAGASRGYTTGQLEGADYEHAALALKSLARLQAPVLGDSKLDDDGWLNEAGALDQELFNRCLPIFLERHPPAEEHRRLLYWMSENLDAWYATRIPPFAISHGDFRLDNIIFLEKDHKRAVAVDWGGSNWCSPLRDASYFLGNGLKIEDRRKWEKQLLREYLDELNRLSKVKITWEQAWEEYCRQAIYGLAQHIPAAGILPDTERGKVMFRTLVSRQAQHAIDLNAMDLVKPAHISYSPNIAEEAEHVPPADLTLWNESWYFDAVTPDGSLGMYARLGRLPNQNRCNFVGGIFRRHEPPIRFIDMNAPLPPSDPLIQTFSTDRFSVECRCLDPLTTFTVKVQGTATAFTDSSAPLRGEDGRHVADVAMDLVFQTRQQPYKKRAQTRYETPCSVDGTIQIGDEKLELRAVPGERNHSWGVRNWWEKDWVWSGLHFEDGVDVFTIALGKGTASSGGAGFVQKEGKLSEISHVVNDFEWEANGLPGKLQLRIAPGDLVIQCEPIAASGLRLLDPAGREAHLPRVMCSAVKSDGVRGVGWLDFNHVVRRDPTPKHTATA
ncbi:hypothetical protein LTR37_013894 [Vermiconidia calcicola]|uniref:Uncharacterized protein n=1 Tax=Vermiconidia calcicola TaxID=1690605 RepID=A0ACC3MVQ7_9PEZI|nr:hypothetical protein LTR37_013894 [Vermiconidia calcicola]